MNTEIITRLIELNHDSAEGLSKLSADLAANNYTNVTVFNGLSMERKENALRLSGWLLNNGGTPPDGPTVGSDLRRALINITGSGLDSVIDEFFGQEAELINTYKEALSDAPAQDLRDLLEQQQQALSKSHEDVRSLLPS